MRGDVTVVSSVQCILFFPGSGSHIDKIKPPAFNKKLSSPSLVRFKMASKSPAMRIMGEQCILELSVLLSKISGILCHHGLKVCRCRKT